MSAPVDFDFTATTPGRPGSGHGRGAAWILTGAWAGGLAFTGCAAEANK
jgi:hypothetical protein